MKLLGKSIIMDIVPHQKGEPILIGFHNWNGMTDCCEERINVTEIGIGILKVVILIEKV